MILTTDFWFSPIANVSQVIQGKEYDFAMCLKIYSFKERLGHGGFGKVYKVVDKFT